MPNPWQSILQFIRVAGTIVERGSKVTTGKCAIRLKIFVSLIHSSVPGGGKGRCRKQSILRFCAEASL